MKGIVLAGGTGSRLWPATKVVSKQLLPIFDKPLIFYPIATLLSLDIREILIITTPEDLVTFKSLLGNGSKLGLRIDYAVQKKPAGIAEAFIIAEDFIGDESVALILGDNIFHGISLNMLIDKLQNFAGAHIVTYPVADPSAYGVLKLNKNNKPEFLIEKPEAFISNLAITGLYFLDKKATGFAKTLAPSSRGELEIVELLKCYLDLGELQNYTMDPESTWMDCGTPNGLNDASNMVKAIEERRGIKIACIEEIVFRKKYIDKNMFRKIIDEYRNNDYAKYLEKQLGVL